jgi:hypothetical protein
MIDPMNRPVAASAMTQWLPVVTTLLSILAAAPAMAEPSQTPDLSGYTPMNAKDYATYYNYPTTSGLQFVTPSGYRCRITYTGRANPPYKSTSCWGVLPGTSSNFVGVTAGMKVDPAQFGNADLTALETYSPPPSSSTPSISPATVSPDAYKPLPAGSKVGWSDSGTCAVTDVMTVCVLGDHGFVLDPHGSRAF